MKIMDDETIMLLLYVGDLFLTGNEKHIIESKKKLAEEFKMKDLMIDALFPQARSVAEPRRNISEPGKVCCGNLKKI